MKNLAAIPSKKPDNHLKKLKNISPGAAYLYKAVILPKMQEKTVNTKEVNMSCFALEDIEILCNYFNANLAVDRPENKVIYSLYTRITNTPPLNCRADFL